MRTFPFIFIPFHSSNSTIPLLYEDFHPDSPHFYSLFPVFPPLFPTFPPFPP